VHVRCPIDLGLDPDLVRGELVKVDLVEQGEHPARLHSKPVGHLGAGRLLPTPLAVILRANRGSLTSDIGSPSSAWLMTWSRR
jgi:hypothetical protein